MDFLRRRPEDLGCSVAQLPNLGDELGASGVLEGGVLLEDEIFLDDVGNCHLFLFLHSAILLY